VSENLEACRVELMDKLLCFMEPTKAMAACCIIIHISGVNTNTRYFMDLVIPRVHCNAKKKDRESATHVYPRA